MKVVLVMFKDGKRREFPLKHEKTVIGRREDCALRVQARDVSRKHCQLSFERDALVVRDLGSSNGTYVNGKRVAEIRVQPGDQLRVGPATFIVQIDGKPARISPSDVATQAAATGAGGKAPSEEEVFELNDEDFDFEDALTELEDLDDDDKLP